MAGAIPQLEDPLPSLSPPALWQGVSWQEWNDWKWQMRNRIKSIEDLKRVVEITDEDEEILQAVINKFHISITPYYFSLINFNDPNDPIKMQCIPSYEEISYEQDALEDPLFEEVHMPAPGLTHRYPDRVLLVVTNICPMYCRHCTRKREWKHGEYVKPRNLLEQAFNYISKHHKIRDVIVSGGDPFTLGTPSLEYILSNLRKIPHVEIIRIGTRVPVTLPQRITDELTNMLEKYGPIWINTHFNHPKEITPEAAKACDKLIRAGCPINNQAVLLKGINDSIEIQKELNTSLLKIKVRPYYLFHCDAVKGTLHFCTNVRKGIEIVEGLRGHISGLAIPNYVIDVPGGLGKVPLQPTYMISMTEEAVVLRNYQGMIARFEDNKKSSHPQIQREGVAGVANGSLPTLIPLAVKTSKKRMNNHLQLRKIR
jgi:lysine 2,3-aminomutase